LQPVAWAASRAQAPRKEEQQLQLLKDGYWLIRWASKQHGLSKQLAAAVIIEWRTTARAAVVVQQSDAMAVASEGAAAGLVITNIFSAQTPLSINQVCGEARGHAGVHADKSPQSGGWQGRRLLQVCALLCGCPGVGGATVRRLGHLQTFRVTAFLRASLIYDAQHPDGRLAVIETTQQ
jgi:hypothetical protein